MYWIDTIFGRRKTAPLGLRGENVAAKHLKKKGYKIVRRRERVHADEIDLVAVNGRTVVFVEVKTRRQNDEESPATAVSVPKQRKLTRAAFTFLKAHGLLEHSARFDVIAVTWPEGDKSPRIEHFENAFEPTESWQLFG